MNHAGEIAPLTRLVRPHVAIITTIAPVHLEFFPSVEAIADAKAEIFQGIEPGGVAVINRDNPHFARLQERRSDARVGSRRVVRRECEAPTRGWSSSRCRRNSRPCRRNILGDDVTYKLGAPGRHVVHEFARGAGGGEARRRRSRDVGAGARRTSRRRAGAARVIALEVPGGSALLIDESYNANPASMRAAHRAARPGAELGPRGRRIAVLGDMLELGAQGADLHRGLGAGDHGKLGRSGVLRRSALSRDLWEALPSDRRGGYAD